LRLWTVLKTFVEIDHTQLKFNVFNFQPWRIVILDALFLGSYVVEISACWYWGCLDFEYSMWTCLCSDQNSLVISQEYSLCFVFTYSLLFCCFQFFFNGSYCSICVYLVFVLLTNVYLVFTLSWNEIWFRGWEHDFKKLSCCDL
jgi:hypothetical protein